ncbi:type VII secretion protein EccB [Nocardiopsis lambiniae]|uniref:Type VII secretion protein EccB n=1 Tax=Nocardiopsis lambiniae TaxID=3075539 RepID=A0ABU2MEQ7_9ACTN|nr:type VII secretion protein EccB [Nocardiopsis sp. DSM 44743]MDT0331171.1 type VII secretion protein EccB [Nocardiopsis sp. DSM 44743]
MQSRRDRVMAHNFTVGRLGTAMLEADPDAVDAPMRRTRNGSYIGLAIGVLLCVGFLVFGLIFPGGANSWRQEGRIVIDRNGGATYLYSGGVLRPVDNLASARLILGEGATSSLVSQRSLEGETVGGPVGIAGAPDTLPEGEGVWRLCAIEPVAGREPVRGRTALTVGEAPEPRVPGARHAVLVSGPDETTYVLWQGTRLRLEEDSGGVQGLGYGTSPVLPVSSAFLNAVPEGPDLVAPTVPGTGEAGPALAGSERRVGQVFSVSTPGQDDQHYLLTRDGLVPLTLTRALLLLADTEISGPAYDGASPEAVPLPASEVHANLAEGEASPESEGLPVAPPVPVEVGPGVPCLRWETDGTMLLTMDAPSSIRAWPVQERPFVEAGCPTPDLVGIPAGEGGLVRARAAAGSEAAPTHYVVTDTAAKYPVADDASLQALGYAAEDAVPLPTSLLRVLPTGPQLNQEAASLPLASSPRAGGTSCP